MSAEGYNPAVARGILRSELKKLRAASGETQEAVAAAAEMSVAKFSRIENATSTVTKADLEILLRHYKVDERRINELTLRAREARAQGWWQDYDFGSDRGFEAYVGYEDGASSIRMAQPLVIPGLLQTPEYTMQVMEGWGLPPEAITRAVKLRAERQHRVAVRGVEQVYVMDEAVIRRPVGTAMSGQLRHLLRIGEKPAVDIRIIPFDRGTHFGQRGPFVLLRFAGVLDDVLYLESARRGDLLIAEDKEQVAGPSVPKVENPADEVAIYQDGFASLIKIALEPAESLALIQEIVDARPS